MGLSGVYNRKGPYLFYYTIIIPYPSASGNEQLQFFFEPMRFRA